MNVNDKNQHPYQQLTPERILNAVDSVGWNSNGRLLALNSYENRVYQVGVDDNEFVIAKFYRPERWSNESILEEHEFSLELLEHDLPVVVPIKADNGKTLHNYEGFRFALYQRCGGHAPALDCQEDRLSLGRAIARIHAIGAIKPFKHRPTLSINEFVEQSVEFLCSKNFIPPEYLQSYQSLIQDMLPLINQRYSFAGDFRYIRIHADLHQGNILWTEQGANFVDFDDTRMGPAIQDLWMFLPGNHQDAQKYLNDFLQGYAEFWQFDNREVYLIEALRTLRIIHYSAWLARRWQDPAFALAFPWFNTAKYWQEHLLSLREQMAVLQHGEDDYRLAY